MTDEQRYDNAFQTRARLHGWSAERVIADIDSIDLFHVAFLPWCRSVQRELLPELMKIMRERRDGARLHAGLLLVYLGEASGTDGIIDSLQVSDPEFQLAALSELSRLLRPNDDSEAPLSVKKEALFAALEPLLETPGVDDPPLQQQIHNLAVELAFMLDRAVVYERMLPLLKHGPTSRRSRLLWHFARRGIDRGALDTAEELLQAGGEVYWVISALETYAKCDDSVIARKAADLLVAFVRANAQRPGNDVTNYLWRALDGIAAAQHPQREALLKQLLDGPERDWRRGEALRHLAAMEGEGGFWRLREALSDPQLRPHAARAIAENPPSSSNPELAASLFLAARQENREHVLRPIVDALLAVGVQIAYIRAELGERLDPIAAMRVHWLTNGITPREATRLFTEAGIVPPLTEQQLEDMDARWEEDPSAYGTVALLLEKRMSWFDTEDGRVPPDYVDLLIELSVIGYPEFQIEAPMQTIDEESGESEIRFAYNNKEYAFTALAYGDYYDVPSVLDALNAALADAGRAERFFSLYTGDQTANVVFVPAGPFLQLSDVLQIPLQQDPQASREQGLAFEKQVFDEIRRQQERDQNGPRAALLRRLLAWFSKRNGQGGH